MNILKSQYEISHKTQSFGDANFCLSWDLIRSYEIFWEWWRKTFLSSKKSVKVAAKYGQLVIVTGEANVSKVRQIIKSGCKLLLPVHFILKRILKVRDISTRWIPHILTDNQTSANWQAISKNVFQIQSMTISKSFYCC